MNNCIILGKIVKKSDIHFDYLNKLKAWFEIYVFDNANKFDIIISEQYMDISLVNKIYNSCNVWDMVCAHSKVILQEEKYTFLCCELYKIG